MEMAMLDQKQLEDLKERVTAAVGLSKLQALSKTHARMLSQVRKKVILGNAAMPQTVTKYTRLKRKSE